MKPRVAMVCSGLGHVRRGNETWAHTVAEALHGAGWPVTLFGGGPLETKCPYVQIRNWPRESFLSRFGMSWHHRYMLEQLSFATAIKRHLARNPHPLIHAADPSLGQRLQRSARELNTQLVYKDGLLLGPSWCRQFDVVQVLAPAYLEAARAANVDVSKWFIVPHLVDTTHFQPPADRTLVRKQLFGDKIPAHACVVLAVGDLSPNSNKRLDWVMREAASLPENVRPYVVTIGQASPADAKAFQELAAGLLRERAIVLTNVKPTDMPAYYQTSDIYAHAAQREPFGIVFLEAMASGLPVLAHNYEVTQWIVGDGGECFDMGAEGVLAAHIQKWVQQPDERKRFSQQARARAMNHFATDRIVPLYEQMYQQITKTGVNS
ncbi:MAG TPA: glycosyltransferase family 4 protein [Verrucomicrobiae bacterium]